MSKDQRSAPRVFYPCEVQCFGVGVHALNPRIADISSTGAFIDTMTAIPAGSRLKLTFTLDGRTLSPEAEVAHSMPQIGMGVRFVNLTDEERDIIDRFVARNA